MSKELMKKTILPMLLLAVWAWIAYHFCILGTDRVVEDMDGGWYAIWYS